MARRRRSLALNISHHVMLRGIDGERVFRDTADYCRLCLMIQKAVEVHGFRVHSFCFMTNHIHLMLEPKVVPLHVCVHAFAGRYAQFFNRKYRRRGYLFQGRFRSIVVSDGVYFRRLIRYIHLNPVAAEIVRRPEEYRWSSHMSYMGFADYTWLTKERVLRRFGSNAQEAASNLLDFIDIRVDAERDQEEIYAAFAAGAYGDDDFVQEYVEDPCVPAASLVVSELSVEQLVARVSELFSVSPQELRSASRQVNVVRARGVLSLAAREASNLSLSDVSRLLGKNQGTISRLASKANTSSQLRSFVNNLLCSSLEILPARY